MIIWGSKGRTKEAEEGFFYCPKCKCRRPYIHKEIGKYFTLYFIPLFRTRKVDEYIECQYCFTPFEMKVLDFDSSQDEKINKLLNSVQSEIDAGTPITVVYKKLLDNGLPENVANIIITMFTFGKTKVCKRCDLFYEDSLEFCSKCGNKLEKIG